jgi:hypothetical protein
MGDVDGLAFDGLVVGLMLVRVWLVVRHVGYVGLHDLHMSVYVYNDFTCNKKNCLVKSE